jgi:hypothetical protein
LNPTRTVLENNGGEHPRGGARAKKPLAGFRGKHRSHPGDARGRSGFGMKPIGASATSETRVPSSMATRPRRRRARIVGMSAARLFAVQRREVLGGERRKAWPKKASPVESLALRRQSARCGCDRPTALPSCQKTDTFFLTLEDRGQAKTVPGAPHNPASAFVVDASLRSSRRPGIDVSARGLRSRSSQGLRPRQGAGPADRAALG